MKIENLNFIKKYKKTSIMFFIFSMYVFFLSIKLLNPQVENLDYYNQKLELDNDVVITNTFDTSHEVCYSWITKIIKNGEERNLINFPHTEELYIKWCAIDIKYIDKNTVEFPICYSWWAWSWECTLIFMQYEVDSEKWFYMWTEDYYVWEDEIPLRYKITQPFSELKYLLSYKKENWDIDFDYLKWKLFWESFNESMQKKHFDYNFFEFINYFYENYGLENYNNLDEIYKSKYELLNNKEKELLLNTIYYYIDRDLDSWVVYEYFDKKIMSFYNKNLDKESKKYIAKLQYVQSNKLYRIKWNNYNKDLWIDEKIKNDFEKILRIEKEKRENEKYWY